MIVARRGGREAMSAADYSHLACPNPDCAAYAQRGAGNLRLHGWSGSGHRIRCLHCVTCGTDFSERSTTPLFGLRTTEDKLAAIAEHLADGREFVFGGSQAEQGSGGAFGEVRAAGDAVQAADAVPAAGPAVQTQVAGAALGVGGTVGVG